MKRAGGSTLQNRPRSRHLSEMTGYYLLVDDFVTVMCVVGNKSDLSSQQVVAHDLAQEYAMSVGAKHFITSAFNNEGETARTDGN